MIKFATTSTTTKSASFGMQLDSNGTGDGVPGLNGTATGATCLSASSSWWEASKTYRSLHSEGSAYIVKTATGYQLSASTYKYCDGVPRVSGTEAVTIPYTTIFVSTGWFTGWSKQPGAFLEYTVPPPSCSVDVLNCKSALGLYHSKIRLGASAHEVDILSELYSPGCSTTTTRLADAICDVFANGPHLIYWPSTLV